MRRTDTRALILLCVMILLIPGSACIADSTRFPVRVEGAIFGGVPGDTFMTEMAFDPAWLTGGDPAVYSADLAAFSALLSTDVYFREKDVARGNPSRVTLADTDPEAYQRENLLNAFGFSDVRYIETQKDASAVYDLNDTATFAEAFMSLPEGNIFVFVFRGSYSIGEWSSVFDAGSPDNSYFVLTGEHPEWVDHRVLKGMDVAFERAYKQVKEYLSLHSDPDRPNYILFTGHSRGGTLAGMMGARAQEEGLCSFTYTFSASTVTTDPAASDYDTVFNLFDKGDFFSDLFLFAGEKFYRFGQDVSTDISASPEILAALSAFKGRDDYCSLNAEERENFRALFSSRFADRESLYLQRKSVFTFDTREEADARREEMVLLCGSESGMDLGPLCELGPVENGTDGRFCFTFTWCDGAILHCYSHILAYGEQKLDPFFSLFGSDDTACRIARFLTEHQEAVNGAHRLVNGYILSGFGL